jgi:hypothetical protein
LKLVALACSSVAGKDVDRFLNRTVFPACNTLQRKPDGDQ